MKPSAIAANLVWAAASQRAWSRFNAALREPARVQRDMLARCLRDNCETVFGRAHRFARLLTATDIVSAYQESVPVTTYDEVEPYVARVAAGEPNVLTRTVVRRLAPSSGSTSAAKLLPYTDDLHRAFSCAVDAWMADLYRRHPSLLAGPAYWCITPSVSFDAAARLGRRAVVPIGFDDDSAYLGAVRGRIARAMFAVPSGIRGVSDPDAFRYITLLFLVAAGDLRLISVWHPSFLSRLLESLPSHFDSIVRDIEAGTLSPSASIASDVRTELSSCLRADPKRAAALRKLRKLRQLDAIDLRRLWPHLALVSCWGDGPALPYASRLERDLQGVPIQRKGLIATEAIVTIPFGGHHPLAIRSHFFEFLDPAGRPRLAHELERDVEYTVVVTTAGGLYRYRLGDRVAVDGWIGETPSLRFLGRADRVSDRFGEKLSDGFVTAIVSDLFAAAPPRFAMLAPERTPLGIAYTLFVEADAPLPEALSERLERALRRNPHYSWCVDLGQLRPARVISVGPGADRAYVDACVARGQRLGDVKPVSLHVDMGWEETLNA